VSLSLSLCLSLFLPLSLSLSLSLFLFLSSVCIPPPSLFFFVRFDFDHSNLSNSSPFGEGKKDTATTFRLIFVIKKGAPARLKSYLKKKDRTRTRDTNRRLKTSESASFEQFPRGSWYVARSHRYLFFIRKEPPPVLKL